MIYCYYTVNTANVAITTSGAVTLSQISASPSITGTTGTSIQILPNLTATVIAGSTLQFSNTFINTSSGPLTAVQSARIVPISGSALTNTSGTGTNLATTPPIYLFTNLINLTANQRFNQVTTSATSSTFNVPLPYTATQLLTPATSYTANTPATTGGLLLLAVLCLTFDKGAFE
jgi:hypothetical protein